MSALDNMVHEKGYEYFDWNCSSGDVCIQYRANTRYCAQCDKLRLRTNHDFVPRFKSKKQQRLKHYQKSLKAIKKEDMSLKESAMIRQSSIMESITKSANGWLFCTCRKKSKELTFDYCFVVL